VRHILRRIQAEAGAKYAGPLLSGPAEKKKSSFTLDVLPGPSGDLARPPEFHKCVRHSMRSDSDQALPDFQLTLSSSHVSTPWRRKKSSVEETDISRSIFGSMEQLFAFRTLGRRC